MSGSIIIREHRGFKEALSCVEGWLYDLRSTEVDLLCNTKTLGTAGFCPDIRKKKLHVAEHLQ